jgi:hypothetical protein
MNDSIYSLLDTAIKIGLGAIIASLSNYLMTKISHKSELKKEIFLRRLNSIEILSKAAEDYFQNWTRYINLLQGISRNTVEKGQIVSQEQWDKIKKRDASLFDSRTNKMAAVSRLKLLGLNHIALMLENTSEIEKEIRDITVFKKEIPNYDFINGIHKKMQEKRNAFYESLNSHYN